MSLLDSNAESFLVAAFRWAIRDDQFAQVRDQVNRLDSSEDVLFGLRVCRDLAAVLERRHHEIAEKALADLEAEMVAQALLTPDALPDRLAAPCAYCGQLECADRFECERLDAGSETTWMRRART